MQIPSRAHPYYGKRTILATKHEKERSIARPLRAAVGLDVCVTDDLDTDRLGTFTGEIARTGTPREVVLRKARMGMEVSGLSLGLASEGSFGFHPLIPFIPSDQELLIFVDDETGIQILEQLISEKTNFAYCNARSLDDLDTFLTRALFPSHGLIVRPHSGIQAGHLYKGITDTTALAAAIKDCVSNDGPAHVETDMRAHMNPTRRKVIRQLAFKLGRRIACLCPACGAPGWGIIDVVQGLPCAWCGTETELVREEIDGCVRCDRRQPRPRADGLQLAPAGQCPMCNP